MRGGGVQCAGELCAKVPGEYPSHSGIWLPTRVGCRAKSVLILQRRPTSLFLTRLFAGLGSRSRDLSPVQAQPLCIPTLALISLEMHWRLPRTRPMHTF